MQQVLKAENISKVFTEPVPFKVLDDITFSVNQGELLSIIGKSGCGKSTLLYVLSTLDTDFEGALELVGKDTRILQQNNLSKLRNAHLGFVFQFHYLLPEFTSLKNIMLPAMKLGKYSLREIEDQAMEKLRLIDMEDQAHKPTSKLSGGQQQRVAIARALINDPDILMCDEPTGNLDAANSDKVFNLFRQLAKDNNQTIIIVTHDMDISDKCDRVIEMSDGKIISDHARV